MSARGYVLVSLAGRKRLVPLEAVREIVAMLWLEPLDGAAGACRGVANLRGEVVPVFDGCAPDAPLSPSRFILVSQTGAQSVGLIVDEVLDVLSLPVAQVAERPVGGGRSQAIARLGDEVIPVLAIDDVVARVG